MLAGRPGTAIPFPGTIGAAEAARQYWRVGWGKPTGTETNPSAWQPSILTMIKFLRCEVCWSCEYRESCHLANDVRMPNAAEDDLKHMRAALALGRRGLGTTWPNPSVGCVLVRHGRVVGRGYTHSGGRPHAEPTALSMASEAARGATAYVTLEPCCHWGQTAPCTDALIQAGVSRVVIAALDPDKRVNSQGVARLREAGITVEHGLLAAEAQDDLQGFFLRIN